MKSVTTDYGEKPGDPPPYYPDEYESNPFNNTVTLEDGTTYDIILDPENPTNVDMVPSNIAGFEMPTLKLGDSFFIVRENINGSYTFTTAYSPEPRNYTSDPASNQVWIENRIYNIINLKLSISKSNK